MTTRDLDKVNHEYLKKINSIILAKLNNPRLTLPDMTDHIKSYNKNKFLSPNQQLEIDNIIEHHKIKW